MYISPPREVFHQFQLQSQYAFHSLKTNWLFYQKLVQHRFFVPVRHGDCSRSNRVRLLWLFVEGPHGGQVQRAASGAGCGQDSDGPGGGAAFVSHLSGFRSGGVSRWVVAMCVSNPPSSELSLIVYSRKNRAAVVKLLSFLGYTTSATCVWVRAAPSLCGGWSTVMYWM